MAHLDEFSMGKKVYTSGNTYPMLALLMLVGTVFFSILLTQSARGPKIFCAALTGLFGVLGIVESNRIGRAICGVVLVLLVVGVVAELMW